MTHHFAHLGHFPPIFVTRLVIFLLRESRKSPFHDRMHVRFLLISQLDRAGNRDAYICISAEPESAENLTATSSDVAIVRWSEKTRADG